MSWQERLKKFLTERRQAPVVRRYDAPLLEKPAITQANLELAVQLMRNADVEWVVPADPAEHERLHQEFLRLRQKRVN